MTRGRLDGRTIVVTRASDQASGFSTMLRHLGADVLEVPLIRIVDPPDGGQAFRQSLSRLDDFDWLIVTSPNGATRVAPYLERRPSGTPKVAAIGTATAAALGRVGADLIPPRQIAESLVEAFAPGPGRVLIAQAQRARPALREGLTARGWTVDTVTAYATEQLPVPAEVADGISRANAITFLSGSAASSFAEACRSTEMRLPPHVISIGPETTKAAAAAGISITATAQTHTLRGIIDTVMRILG